MKTLDFILNLKHWQVFLILIICGFLKVFEWGGNQLLSAIFSSVGIAAYAAWTILAGHGLYRYYPDIKRMNYKVFSICSILWIVILVVSQFISVLFDLNFMEILTIPGLLLVFLAGIFCVVFTSMMIESVDSGKEVTFLESYGVFMLLLIMPIGIWFLQPMINKAMDTRIKEPKFQS